MNSISATIPAADIINDATLGHLRFRRQYYLGPAFLVDFPDWVRMRISDQLSLTAHPDLDVTQVHSSDEPSCSCTLLGFVLDPRRPEASSQDIVQTILAAGPQLQDMLRATDSLGGRWVLILRRGAEITICHDAAGLRQIAYMKDPVSGQTVCAAHPGLLAKIHSLTSDPLALEYIVTRGDSDFEVYWLPGNRTIYSEVRMVLPNHWLRIDSGVQERYWSGIAKVVQGDFDEVLLGCTSTLKGFLEAARQRYSLAVAMTAGWDSRLMLALGRPLAEQLYCFTLTYPHIPLSSRDVAVPGRLLARLGIVHHLVRYPSQIDLHFKDIFKESTPSGSAAYCADAQAMYEQYPGQRLCLTGDVAEIVKCHYRLGNTSIDRYDAHYLAKACGLQPHPFVLAALEEWREGAQHCTGIHLLDLLCWEQMGGRWQAMIRAEYDLVQESFAPLNCRQLLVSMLSVDERYRRAPDFLLFYKLIAGLWADVLLEPINPPENLRVTDHIIRLLVKLQVFGLVPRPLKEAVKAMLR